MFCDAVAASGPAPAPQQWIFDFMSGTGRGNKAIMVPGSASTDTWDGCAPELDRVALFQSSKGRPQRKENLLRLRKGLAETQGEAARNIILQLPARQEANDGPPARGS
jgi:hypothetical protein